MHAPSEIGYFEFPVEAYEEVLWFDIAVDDVFAVKVPERVCHLVDVLCVEKKRKSGG